MDDIRDPDWEKFVEIVKNSRFSEGSFLDNGQIVELKDRLPALPRGEQARAVVESVIWSNDPKRGLEFLKEKGVSAKGLILKEKMGSTIGHLNVSSILVSMGMDPNAFGSSFEPVVFAVARRPGAAWLDDMLSTNSVTLAAKNGISGDTLLDVLFEDFRKRAKISMPEFGDFDSESDRARKVEQICVLMEMGFDPGKGRGSVLSKAKKDGLMDVATAVESTMLRMKHSKEQGKRRTRSI